MKLELSKSEITIINLLRQANPYSIIKVEKRPTTEKPSGDYSRITIESSTLLKDLLIIETE